MVKSQIQPGIEYALREKRGIDIPFQHVRVISHVRGNKWKVVWIEPNPGLVDYIESKQIIVLWKDRKAFLKEEENERRLEGHNKRNGYDHDDSPIANALYTVFDCVGDGIHFYKGSLTAKPDALTRLRGHAQIGDVQESWVMYHQREPVPTFAAAHYERAGDCAKWIVGQ
jgi:hypothetical protein